MSTERLSDDLIAVLRILKEKGGTDCTGTCHHRKPGEFHCHTLGNMINVSSQGVKNRLLSLMRMGLVERVRIQREDDTMLVRFLVTPQGDEILAQHDRALT
jgi:DNA-binding MarR family transcriptional regulator